VSLLASGSASCLARNEWICPEYVETRRDTILSAAGQHVTLTLVSVLIGLALAIPLALLSRRVRGARGAVLGTSTAIYTIPSLALYSLLVPYTGLSRTTVVIGLALYSLTILVRGILAGLDGVPADVLESARGMGMGARRILLRVELPLALPTIFAALRVATVSTVALVTVGFIVGYGGLGNLINEGLRTLFKSQVLTASLLCVAIAVVADLALLAVQRAVTPWQRGRA
jgi:osmoprotectant transport system permease protein